MAANPDDDGFFTIEQLLSEEYGGDVDVGFDVGESSTFSSSFSENEIEYLVRKVKPELNLEQRRKIIEDLLAMQIGVELPRGSQSKVAKEMGVHRSTVCRHYKRARECRERGEAIDIRPRKAGNCGRKETKYSDEFLSRVPLQLRTTVRAFAGFLKIAPSTVHKLLKNGRLRSHTSNTHPSITPDHKLVRMQWVLSHIEPGTSTQKPTFIPMENIVHIDEKWFVMNPDLRRFYLLPWEENPYRCAQSKNCKIKVMFMGVTSRPIYDSSGKLIHDGKFGIYPFVNKVAAKKTSKNRPRGTIETKPIEKINQEVIRSMIINKVIPGIMQKWPDCLPKDIIIQQDNARPHISPNDPQFLEAANQNGFNMQLVFQPLQSPDLNVLDLAQFRALQSLMYQSFPQTVDELIQKVEEVFVAFEPRKMNFTWLQLQYVMVEILKCRGSNNYKNPHHGKERMERIGQLPHCVEVDQELINESVKYLNERLIPVADEYELLDEDFFWRYGVNMQRRAASSNHMHLGVQ